MSTDRHLYTDMYISPHVSGGMCMCIHTHVHTHIFTWRRPPLLSSSALWPVPSTLQTAGVDSFRDAPPSRPSEVGGESPQPTTFLAGAGAESWKPARTCGTPGRVAAAVDEVRVAQEACGQSRGWSEPAVWGAPCTPKPTYRGAWTAYAEGGFHNWRTCAERSTSRNQDLIQPT